jgi:Heparinase II/III-like protein
VDGKNQTCYEFHKQKFKIKGQQPDYDLKAFVSRPGFDYIHGIAYSHEYPVVHERKILFVNGEYWLICDVLRANEVHNYDLLFHLASSAQNRVSLNTSHENFIVEAPNLVMIQPDHRSATVSLEGGFVSPAYGMKQQAPVIKFNKQAADCCFYTVIYPYKDNRPTISVSTNPVIKETETNKIFEAGSLTIDIESGCGNYQDTIFVAHDSGGYKADGLSLNGPVFCQRKSHGGQVISQFDYKSEVDRSWFQNEQS